MNFNTKYNAWNQQRRTIPIGLPFVGRTFWGLWLVLTLAQVGIAQTDSGGVSEIPQQPVPLAVTLEDVEQSIGPLKTKEQNFKAILHGKRARMKARPDIESEETVVKMEIRDEAGTIHFEKLFPYSLNGSNFEESNSVSAEILVGKQRSGILVTYSVDPSTPLGGTSYQVFGMFDDKLVPFSKPVSVEGQLIGETSANSVMKTSAEPGLDAEVLRFRVWSGNVFVILPVRVDWLQTKMGPAWRCTKMTSRGNLPICRFSVEADRVPQQDELTFVRLHAEADEGFGAAEHVVIKKNSKVEILEAEGELVWQEGDDQIGLGVGEDLWLRVRIDGKEGWIHTQEDFNAIGLPQAG